ncbi:MAG: hypothetical protein HDR37_06465 [Treponema sp.]|nr:hypothetical protein [Treponema sp.]
MVSKTNVQKKQSSECIRNRVCTILACAALLLAQSCTNVVHELIPPSDSGIHSFFVENTDRTRYRAAETDSTDITITVPANTDITSLVPIIELDPKSAVIPVTLPYIHRAFPSADLMSLAVQMNASQKAGDLANWMLNFIRENKDFSVPPLDEPVDFTQPVMFCVIAGRGNYKLYTVTVVQEKTENPADPENPSPSKPDDPYAPGTPSKPSDPMTAECEKKILSFVVNEPKQAKPSVITEDSVKFYLNAGADRSALYPAITVSKGAGILPLTQEYILRLFSYTELISFYSGFASAKDINAFISATIKKLDADKIAKIMEADLSLPIDFSGFNGLFGLVPFAVIGADKTAHVYYISCVTTEGTAALTAFAVTKIRNPGLMGDADISINGDAVTITATYPVEYPNFKLIPDIVIEGDTWEITNGTLRTENVGTSGEEAEYTAGLKKAIYLVPNDAYPVGNEYTATLTVRRGEAAAAYTLRLIYKEDPDTIRSITDFRFLRLRNPGIKTSAMASISKSEDTGFISATILYEGNDPPYDLVADFYSPGICTVEHVEQVSGRSRNNFQYDVYILCTSKNKLFCRLYTVHITFIKVKTAEAVLNYFSFPKHLNPDLSQSATGLIDESSGTVYISAKYHTPEKPARLVPEFAATGIVSVNSILQSSGYSAQDFSRSVYYSVRDQNDWSSDSRTYRISVNWEKDEQSACAITSFGFSTADNPSLEKEVSARINERSGTIYALLPKGAGKSNLVPYFSAQGTVTIDSVEQISGGSRLDFSGEVIYTVTSANGLYSKQYTVSVQEAGPVIYVNAAAIGRNNGTCWQDAYITLDAAFEQAEAYGDTPKEIWIAYNGGEAYAPLSNAYRQNGLPLTANTAIRGGFDGTETDADERRTKQRKIEFDVNAVENANDNKRKTIPIRHEAAVCMVQTKLLQPNSSTDSHLFRGDTLSGEIVFDGIEMETSFEENSNNFLLDVNDMKTATLSLIDCTVRCLAFSQQNSEHSLKAQNIFVQNSDLYIQYLAADTIKADNSRFYAQKIKRHCIIYGTGEYENCYFKPVYEQGYLYDFKIGLDYRNQTASVKKCFFEYGNYFESAIFHAEDCHLKINHSMHFSCIKNCFIECNTLSCHSNINIEGSYITPQSHFTYVSTRGDSLKFSMKNSIVVARTNLNKSNKLIDNQHNFARIELENSKITGYDSLGLCGKDGEITMIYCSFDSKYKTNSHFIYAYAKTINIENCNFDLQNTYFISPYSTDPSVGFLKIKDNIFKLPQGRFQVNSNEKIEFTKNTIESELSSVINLISSDSLKFTDNKFYGRWTDITATNIDEFAGNTYDSFVIYNISVGNNNKQPNFFKETINIKKPLYTTNGTEYTKKAYLTLTNGNISNVPSDDFFCGYNLSNSDATLTNLNLSEKDFPLYADKTKKQIVMDDTTEVFHYNGNILELTNCIINGKVEHTLTSHYQTKIENSNIDKYSLTTNGCEILISNSTIHNLVTKGITKIYGSTINEIDSSSNLTTNSFENGRRTKIKHIKTIGNITISLSNTDFNGEDFTITTSRTGMAITDYGYGKPTSLTINNCIFSNYECFNNSGYSDVVYTNAETLNITNSIFENCKNEHDAINANILSINSKNINITDSEFRNNFSRSKVVACHCSDAVLEISQSKFYNNKELSNNGIAYIPGSGAIYFEGNEMNIKNSTFSNNYSNSNGGAIYCFKGKIIIEENSKFDNNKANNHGGAIYFSCNEGNEINIKNSTFSNNSTETSRGGALNAYITNLKEFSINDCNFSNNQATSTDYGGGGAIAINFYRSNQSVSITGGKFEKNTAKNYGNNVFVANWTDDKNDNCSFKVNGCPTLTEDTIYKYKVEVIYGNLQS